MLHTTLAHRVAQSNNILQNFCLHLLFAAAAQTKLFHTEQNNRLFMGARVALPSLRLACRWRTMWQSWVVTVRTMPALMFMRVRVHQKKQDAWCGTDFGQPFTCKSNAWEAVWLRQDTLFPEVWGLWEVQRAIAISPAVAFPPQIGPGCHWSPSNLNSFSIFFGRGSRSLPFEPRILR